MTRRRTALITDAEASQDAQLRSRQIRYASMMGIRVVFLIVAGVLVSVQAPMLWLWLPLCVAGMVFLPWMAVLIANDRPPKEKHRLGSVLRGRRGARDAEETTDRQVTGGTPERRAIPADEHRVIDAEP
ncbi:MAG: DUF3099 domain-containing protein [Micromonosporaceae bacterium]|nr:DUF3099 domain-containing protein [Micromonosporaceae bacterium]